MIINCTPHEVCIYTPSNCYMRDGFLYLRDYEGEFPQPILTYPAAKEPARVTFIRKPAGMADGNLIFRWAPNEIVNLVNIPGPNPDTYYIVSKMVAQAYPERKDLIFPGTLVRDADDYVVGCIDFFRV